MNQDYFQQIIYLQNKRNENMDRFLVESREVTGAMLRLFVVCDGVGSTPRGGQVAQEVVSQLWDWFYALVSLEDVREKLMCKIRHLNEELFEKEQKEKLPRGATTLSLLLLVDQQFFIVHLGDSRIFARKEGAWLQLTEDHSIAGALTEVVPKDRIHPLCWGGAVEYTHFLLATDGFYRKLDWTELENNLPQSFQDTQFLPHLAEQVMEKGERDNMTGIFFSFYSQQF